MTAVVRLYACALVLAVWTVLWAAGLRTDTFVGFMLALTAVALVVSERERGRRREVGRR